MSRVARVPFTDYLASTTQALDLIHAAERLPKSGCIILKSKLHTPSTHKSVVDICRYKKPDLCVVDGVTALQGMHLSGTPLHLNTLLASFDPVAVDAVGSELLGHDPRRIEYLRLANGTIGSMEAIETVAPTPVQGCRENA